MEDEVVVVNDAEHGLKVVLTKTMGYDVVATHPFDAGNTLTFYQGRLLDPTAKARSPAHVIRTPLEVGSLYSMYRIDGNTDPRTSVGYGSFCNAPEDPTDWGRSNRTAANARMVWHAKAFEQVCKRFILTGDDDAGRVVSIVATKDIRPGDRVLIFYRQDKSQIS